MRAVLPVHVYGRPADLGALVPLAAEHGLAAGRGRDRGAGQPLDRPGPAPAARPGPVGHGGVLSFNGNKIATCGGGGAYVTSDAAAAARVRHLTTQAKTDTRRFVHDETGWNYRLTNVAAAIGLAQLEQLAGFIAAKRACHELYAELLAERAGHRARRVRRAPQPNYWFHSVLVDAEPFGRDREALMEVLAEHGIETRPVWGLLHEQAPLRDCTAWRIERAPRSGGACSTCRARATSGGRRRAGRRGDPRREEDGLMDDRVRDDRHSPATRVGDALRRMDESGGRMVLVTDDDDTLRGVATDGDMRRWIIAGRGSTTR